MSENSELTDSITSLPEISNLPGESGSTKALYGWIKRQLGHPTLRVELTEDQIYDALADSLNYYMSYAERPPKYWQFLTQAGVNTYPLPTDFETLNSEVYYLPNTIVNFIQSFTAYQLYLNFTGNLDITQFEATMQALQLKLNRIGAVSTWEIIYHPPRIKIYPMPSIDGLPVLFSYNPKVRLEDWVTQSDPNGWDWVRKYALAKCKIVLGRLRSRYGDIITAGAQPFTQDGTALVAEGKEEIAALDVVLEGLRAPLMPEIF
jgi:hypothetical protein